MDVLNTVLIIRFDSTDHWQGLILACRTLPRFFYATNNISRLLTLMSNKKPGQSGQPDFVPFALAINVKWLLEYHENEFLLSLFCSTRINPISVIKCSGFRCHDPGITIFTNFFFSLPLAFNIIKTRPAPDRYNINTVFLRVKKYIARLSTDSSLDDLWC